MDITVATELVINATMAIVGTKEEITGNTQLIGGGSLLDSLKLVELCLALEDIAEDNSFEFDWTSDSTMSKSRSMFRTIASLAQEFSNQSEN